MKTSIQQICNSWGRFALLLGLAIIIAACGGDATPEPTVAPIATLVPTAPAAVESPLAQPESPLLQPESPLTTSVSKPQNEEEAIALAAVTTAPVPAEGMGSVSGVVYSFGSVPGAIPETVVYLETADVIDGKFFPAAVATGPRPNKGDVTTITNEYGQMQLDAQPGNYYLVVWTVYDWLIATPSIDDESPRLITIEEGNQLDLGVLYVNWP